MDGRVPALAHWCNELIADLGGAREVSTQELAIIDAAAKTTLLLDSLDTRLLQQKTLIIRRRRSVYSVVLQRQQIADALTRYMAQLGLKRRSKPTRSLHEVLNPESSEQQNA